MCKCTPNKKTPFCGLPGCEWPKKRGGLRNPPGGRPPLKIKREKHSVYIAPGTKQLAQAIAKERGYPGWGYALDEAVKLLAKETKMTKYNLASSMSDRVDFDRVQEEYAYQMMNALSHDEAMAQNPDQYAEIGWEAFEIDMEAGLVKVDDIEEAKARFFSAFEEGMNRWKKWNAE